MKSEDQKSVLSRRQILGFGAVVPLSGYALHENRVVKSASQKRPAWKQEVLYHGATSIGCGSVG